MKKSVVTVRVLLDQELKQRYYVSGIKLTAEELFDRNKLEGWLRALVGESVSGKLDACIAQTSDERLSHAAAAYLLGMALRSNLQLHFDLMPRIVAHSASDGFHFFWAIICLCHDLGYRFENDSPKDEQILEKMKTADGRMELLGIEYDLLGVDRAELCALGIDPDEDEGRWILDSVELARKYDRYRRQTCHRAEFKPVADHGICGALLLYDILRIECENIRRRRRMRCFVHPTRHDPNGSAGNLDGAAKDSTPTRFILCSLMIACTVARHNMWLAAKKEDRDIYQRYGLEKLFADASGVKIRADEPMAQMLFFLDYVDTIDPVKWFYLRDVENGPAKGECDQCYRERLQRQYSFMLDRVAIDFTGCADRRFSLLTISGEREEKAFFRVFTGSTAKLTDWLEAPAPVVSENRITYEMPITPEKKNAWPCRVTDDEINSLLLYMGCGVPGQYGAFYSSSKAYQTFNLLLMEGCDGERVRVCQEKQSPQGVFITEWKRSLEVMTDIFRAQCKYGRNPDAWPMTDILFRSDRQINFRMMQSRGSTYAMTSTSRGSYLEEFLVDKVDPRILHIKLVGKVPYFDYEGFFGDQYVYADEREVLLPPMLTMEIEWKTDFVLSVLVDGQTEGRVVRWYDISVHSFDQMVPEAPDVPDPVQYLKDHAEKAAAALDKLAETHDMEKAGLTDPKHDYWTWKRCYQYILQKELQGIYETEFLHKVE